MGLLTRYWFTFEMPDGFTKVVGVTAYTLEDARSLIQKRVFSNMPLPIQECVIENVDVSTLDEGKILPNIGASSFRGIWYPNLI